jgi:hypothetical protein
VDNFNGIAGCHGADQKWIYWICLSVLHCMGTGNPLAHSRFDSPKEKLLMTQLEKSTSLYERDILLWSEETAAKLRARDFDNLDIENLIEEVEALGISQKKELISRLIVLLEYLLKRL